MPITKEILDMFEFSRNQKKTFPSITISMNDLCQNKEVFLLCDGLRLFLSMALSIAISHNHRSVGTPLYKDKIHQHRYLCTIVLTIVLSDSRFCLNYDSDFRNYNWVFHDGIVLSVQCKLQLYVEEWQCYRT